MSDEHIRRNGVPLDTVPGSVLTAQGDILVRDASGPARLAPAMRGQVLITQGSGLSPRFSSIHQEMAIILGMEPCFAFFADIGASVSSGLVDSLTDFSGYGVVFSQSGSARPTFVESGINSLPALDLDGSTQYMDSAAFPAVAQALTIVAVGYSTQDASRELIDCDKTAAGSRAVVSVASAGALSIYGGTTLSGTSDVTSASVIMGVFNSASSAIYKNDSVTPVASGAANTGGITASGLRLGALGGVASAFWKGRIAALFAFPSSLSAVQRRKLARVLGTRYAIGAAA